MSVQRRLLLMENSTFVTPTLSVAVAVIVTEVLLATVLPFAGEVIATPGCIVSAERVGVGGTGVAVGVGVEVGIGVGVEVEVGVRAGVPPVI